MEKEKLLLPPAISLHLLHQTPFYYFPLLHNGRCAYVVIRMTKHIITKNPSSAHPSGMPIPTDGGGRREHKMV